MIVRSISVGSVLNSDCCSRAARTFFASKIFEIFFKKTRLHSPFWNQALSSSETARSVTFGTDFVPEGSREIITKRAVRMSLNGKKYSEKLN